jgi:pimeloyl-ACP methyl ester carboxylesterase
MPHTEASGIRIAYDEVGWGEPALLFLGGWCTNRTVFRDLVSLSSECRRVITFDWRGHGESAKPAGDFGEAALVEDALAVLAATEAKKIVPVALAHAGWVAIELRRRLGERVPKLVLLDWIVTEPPAAFLDMLKGMQSAQSWRQTVDQIFSQWLHGVNIPPLEKFLHEEMGAYPAEMWARAAREIAAAYAKFGSPLNALAQLSPPVPVLHLYAQPDDPGYLAAQQKFAAAHPWFRAEKLDARSHFPMFEISDKLKQTIEDFVAGT